MEHYNFTWEGKEQSKNLIKEPTKKTLLPAEEHSKNWNDTENIIITGDNIDALKILHDSYSEKVKMIYIDPPYNTGNEFIYSDNIKEKKIKRSKKHVKKHTNWLNMMYPRLSLARELLTDDGVIFISIDDNEQANLKKICDEIFGEGNFFGSLIRKTRSVVNNIRIGLNMQHEYCLLYAKDYNKARIQGETKSFDKYTNPDNDKNGAWVSGSASAPAYNYINSFEIRNPYTNKIDLPPLNRTWVFSKKRFNDMVKSGKVIFKKKHKKNEIGFILKRYKNEIKNKNKLVNSLCFTDNAYMNQAGTKENNILLGELAFSFPKPTNFIKNMIKYATNINQNDIILDFFAGSGTTGHAAMQLNAEDGGNRKYIMIQLDEKINETHNAYRAGYKTIDEITRERIRRAGDKIIVEKPELKGKLDIGFKAFTLSDD